MTPRPVHSPDGVVEDKRPQTVDEHPFVVASIQLRDALRREPRSPLLEPIFAEFDKELRELLVEDPRPREAGEEHPLYRKDGAPDSGLAGEHYDTSAEGDEPEPQQEQVRVQAPIDQQSSAPADTPADTPSVDPGQAND